MVVCLSHSEMFLRVQYPHIGKYIWTSPDKKKRSRVGYFLMLASGRWHSSVL